MASSFAKAIAASPVFRGLRPYNIKKRTSINEINKNSAAMSTDKAQTGAKKTKKYSACGIFAQNAFSDYVDLSIKSKPNFNSTYAAIGILSPGKNSHPRENPRSKTRTNLSLKECQNNVSHIIRR